MQPTIPTPRPRPNAPITTTSACSKNCSAIGRWGWTASTRPPHNLIDEGQFGAPIILTPFNYAAGRQYGAEATLNYQSENFNAYVNAAYERAVGKHIVSSEFQFDPGDLAYIANHYIPLDHQQLGSGVGGRVL